MIHFHHRNRVEEAETGRVGVDGHCSIKSLPVPNRLALREHLGGEMLKGLTWAERSSNLKYCPVERRER